MASKKIQLYTDRDKTIEASPETSANCVILSDGNDLQKVLDNDLTTPTVVHEETSFKVGVGDVNVSSSVVDGESSKVVIKGKTYQNILPEPSLRNSMTNGKSMQKLNEGYENVNVVDGVAKSAILKGNTLVNLNNGQRNETLDSTIGNGSSRTYACKIPYTIPSGTYITFKLKTNTINGITGNLKAHFKQNAATTTTGDRYPTLRNYNSHPTGEYYINVCHQTPIDLEAINLYIDDNVGVIDVSDVMILIGDYTNVDIPYFEGMQSVRMPVLTTTGKNLWNNYTLERGSINHLSGDNLNQYTTQTRSKDYIPIVQNTKYIATSYGVDGTTSSDLIRYYDSEKKFIGTSPNEKSTFLRTVFQMDIDNISHIQLEQGAVATPYEPYKSNILSISEDVVLCGVGDVKDTMNVLTGDIVKRTNEITLNGTENWTLLSENDDFIRFSLVIDTNNVVGSVLCDKLPTVVIDLTQEGINVHGVSKYLQIVLSKTKVNDLETFKSWLNENNLKVVYVTDSETHKTVDLSAYGNWRKIVLDGVSRVDWVHDPQFNRYYLPFSSLLKAHDYTGLIFCDNEKYTIAPSHLTVQDYDYAISGYRETHTQYDENWLYIAIKECTSKQMLLDYLSQNPITVWYQTTTSQANSITEMLSFSNGHIQLSSEEGSLIPSLDYEVPTSNSYHMDLMKANTIYTMKLSTGNGSLVAHNGQTIGYMTNRTFDSGQLPINNLFYTTGWVNDLMILEGDVTSKSLPYFKGIRSAFEDESKIEVLSTGKNLFDRKLSEYDYLGNYDKNEVIIGDNFIEWNASSTYKGAAYYHFYVKPNTSYTLSLERNIMQRNCTTIYDGFVTSNMNSISNMEANKNNISFVTLSNKITIRFSNGTILNETFKIYNVQLEEGGTVTTYEPYKSNSTKIPLLSPLRSLPNGVCDELIIDRMKKKAILIQRVGKAMVTAHQVSHWYMDNNGVTNVSRIRLKIDSLGAKKGQRHMINNLVPATGRGFSLDGETTYMDDEQNYWLWLHVSNNRLPAPTIEGFKSWLSQNPLVTYYELETPVVTEIDLEGFPLVYKDGHIFLNSEIAPVVEIAYNVNQTQQIQANNETLQRHELDILDLDNLIVSFVNAEYNLRLLKFDMELSMMALAE